MIDIIVAIIATIAAVFILLAAIGVVKMPDTFLRISATTKASTFGVGLSMLCAAIYFQDMAITFKIIAIVSRSEERRVGKECRSRWVPERSRKKEENG